MSFRNMILAQSTQERTLQQALQDKSSTIASLQAALASAGERYAEDLDVLRGAATAAEEAAATARRELTDGIAAHKEQLLSSEKAREALQRSLLAKDEHIEQLEKELAELRLVQASASVSGATASASRRTSSGADGNAAQLLACVEEHLRFVKQAATAAGSQEAALKQEVASLRTVALQLDSKLTECLLQQAEAQARWAEKTSNLALPRGCPSEADRRADLAHAGHCAAAVPGVNASTDALAKQVGQLTQELHDTKRALAMTSQLLQQAVSTVKQQEAALLACKASDVMDPANAANTPTEVITRGTASVGSYHDALEALPESSDNIAKPLSGTQASGTQVHVSE